MCQTRRHLTTWFARTCQTRQHSPTCFAQAHQTCRHSPNHFARTRQTRERQVWRFLREFSEFDKFGKFGKFSECRLDRFIHLNMLFVHKTKFSCLHQHSSRGLASTRQTRRHSPTCFARTRQTRKTRRHSPTCFARTRRHSPKAIFEKNVTRLAKFAQVLSESRKFGTSCHSLPFT